MGVFEAISNIVYNVTSPVVEAIKSTPIDDIAVAVFAPQFYPTYAAVTGVLEGNPIKAIAGGMGMYGQYSDLAGATFDGTVAGATSGAGNAVGGFNPNYATDYGTQSFTVTPDATGSALSQDMIDLAAGTGAGAETFSIADPQFITPDDQLASLFTTDKIGEGIQGTYQNAVGQAVNTAAEGGDWLQGVQDYLGEMSTQYGNKVDFTGMEDYFKQNADTLGERYNAAGKFLNETQDFAVTPDPQLSNAFGGVSGGGGADVLTGYTGTDTLKPDLTTFSGRDTITNGTDTFRDAADTGIDVSGTNATNESLISNQYPDAGNFNFSSGLGNGTTSITTTPTTPDFMTQMKDGLSSLYDKTTDYLGQGKDKLMNAPTNQKMGLAQQLFQPKPMSFGQKAGLIGGGYARDQANRDAIAKLEQMRTQAGQNNDPFAGARESALREYQLSPNERFNNWMRGPGGQLAAQQRARLSARGLRNSPRFESDMMNAFMAQDPQLRSSLAQQAQGFKPLVADPSAAYAGALGGLYSSQNAGLSGGINAALKTQSLADNLNPSTLKSLYDIVSGSPSKRNSYQDESGGDWASIYGLQGA